MTNAPFTLFGPAHFAAIVLTMFAAWRLVRFYRATAAVPQQREKWNRWLAGVLVLGVLMDPLCAWWRHAGDPAEAWRVIRENSLPVHLCDVVACLLAVALLRRSQRCAELGYLWGLSGTAQGLITPGLEYGFPAPEFFGFFLQHGGVPAIALGLALGTRLAPRPGAVWRAMGWINVYLAAIFVLNWLCGTNYGYVNHKPPPPTLMDFLGPWPLYILSLQAVALVFFLLLLLPLRGRMAAQASNSTFS